MPRVRLEDTKDWQLADKSHDVRGRELRDSVGRALGTIKTMIVDTDAQRVESVVLENGTEYPVRDLQIMEQAVYFIPSGAGGMAGTAEPSPYAPPPSAPLATPAAEPPAAPASSPASEAPPSAPASPFAPPPTYTAPSYAPLPPYVAPGPAAEPALEAQREGYTEQVTPPGAGFSEPAVPPPAPPAHEPPAPAVPPPAPPSAEPYAAPYVEPMAPYAEPVGEGDYVGAAESSYADGDEPDVDEAAVPPPAPLAGTALVPPPEDAPPHAPYAGLAPEPAFPTHASPDEAAAAAGEAYPPAVPHPAAPDAPATGHVDAHAPGAYEEPRAYDRDASDEEPRGSYDEAAPRSGGPTYESTPDYAGGEAARPDESDDAYRAHFEETYPHPGYAYDDFADVYRFGREAAADPALAGRDAYASEAELRTRFNERYGYPAEDRRAWLGVRSAVFHAFDRARRSY